MKNIVLKFYFSFCTVSDSEYYFSEKSFCRSLESPLNFPTQRNKSISVSNRYSLKEIGSEILFFVPKNLH